MDSTVILCFSLYEQADECSLAGINKAIAGDDSYKFLAQLNTYLSRAIQPSLCIAGFSGLEYPVLALVDLITELPWEYPDHVALLLDRGDAEGIEVYLPEQPARETKRRMPVFKREDLLEMALRPCLTANEERDRARAWVRGELMWRYPELTWEDADARTKDAENRLFIERGL